MIQIGVKIQNTAAAGTILAQKTKTLKPTYFGNITSTAGRASN